MNGSEISGCNGAGGDDSEFVSTVHALVIAHAKRAARRLQIRDYEEDLVQQSLASIWAAWTTNAHRPSDAEVEQLVTTLGRRERRRRQGEVSWRPDDAANSARATPGRRERARFPDSLIARGVQERRKGVPGLCSHLTDLAADARRRARFRGLVLAAAVTLARDPEVLTASQYRVFCFAYIYGQSAEEIAQTLSASAPAITKRLQRISRKIEQRLIARVMPALSSKAQARTLERILPVQGNTGSPRLQMPDSEAILAEFSRALEDIVHSDPGN